MYLEKRLKDIEIRLNETFLLRNQNIYFENTVIQMYSEKRLKDVEMRLNETVLLRNQNICFENTVI